MKGEIPLNMARVFVSVGSNIDKERNITSAIAALQAEFGELIRSKVYQTEAVGFEGADFHNLVIGFDTCRSPKEVAEVLSQIEQRHGRKRRQERFLSRTLDLDLLLYADLIIQQDGLQLPRDEITRYAFVLGPLAEIAGDLKHPQLGKPLKELWAEMRSHEAKLLPIQTD